MAFSARTSPGGAQNPLRLCEICMMEFKARQARHAEVCAQAAERELFSSREEAEAARVRAEAAETIYLDLRDKAARARREANASLPELAARHKAERPLLGCTRPWWENRNHAVVVVEDYESQQAGVFSLRVDERLYVLYHDPPGEWLYGVLPGREEPLGWFPSRAVKPGPPFYQEPDVESSRDSVGVCYQ